MIDGSMQKCAELIIVLFAHFGKKINDFKGKRQTLYYCANNCANKRNLFALRRISKFEMY